MKANSKNLAGVQYLCLLQKDYLPINGYICSYRLDPNLHPAPQGSDSVVLGHGSETGPADLATGRPGDCQTNVCCMLPEKLVDAISGVLNLKKFPPFTRIISCLPGGCLKSLD